MSGPGEPEQTALALIQLLSCKKSHKDVSFRKVDMPSTLVAHSRGTSTKQEGLGRFPGRNKRNKEQPRCPQDLDTNYRPGTL